MKLFEKIKDLFMDEVTDDDEILLEEKNQEEYKEPPKDVLPKVMRDTIRKEEEKVELKVNQMNSNLKEEPKEIRTEVNEPQKKLSLAINLEEDFPSRTSNNNEVNKNVLRMERETTRKTVELYPKKEKPKEKPKFKATPVISPVYGILDKNYYKDEVKEKTDDVATMKRPSKKVDFETVRKKAFGNLADEIKDNLMCENCELYKEVKKISSLTEDDLLYDMTIEDEKQELTIEKAYDDYEEFGVAYEPKGRHEEVEIPEEVSLDEEKNEEIVVKEIPIDEDNVIEEEIEKKVPSRSSKLEEKETKVDEDFFELIDSMYKERVDE